MAHQVQLNPESHKTGFRNGLIAAILAAILALPLTVYAARLADTGETIFSPAYQWHTFHGSTVDESAYDLAIAADGGIYIVGEGYATWNGPGGQPPLHPYSESNDILVIKLDRSGRYQWHTFFGSTGDDTAYDVALGADDSLYITGASDLTWQGAGNAAPLHAHSGEYDVFVLKLTSAGAYQWHTFYGSEDYDEAFGVAVHGANVYITGYSFLSWDGPGSASPLHTHTDQSDILILKLNSSGTYQWHTFYGSGEYDEGYAIAAAGDGSVYIAALSDITWNGDGVALPLHAHSAPDAGSANADLTVMKLNANGGHSWHTFYGSINAEEVNDIALGSGGMLYAVGASNTSWLGAGGISPIHPHSGMNDLAALKLDSSGAYQWHTFYGSNWQDYGSGIAVHQDGVYITGESWSTWQGDGAIPPLAPHHGDADISILKLNTVGGYQWHTFHGSSAWDAGFGISAVYTDTLIVSGGSASTWQGARFASPLNPFSGSDDLLVLKLGIERDIFLPLVER